MVAGCLHILLGQLVAGIIVSVAHQIIIPLFLGESYCFYLIRVKTSPDKGFFHPVQTADPWQFQGIQGCGHVGDMLVPEREQVVADHGA